MHNRKPLKNSSGFSGVTSRRGHFETRIAKNGKSIYLGTFHTLEEAALAYSVAKVFV
jgi:hypothetical protein